MPLASLADFLTALLPFLLLFGFWIFVMKRVQGRPTPGQEQLVQKLDEIREELRRLREAVQGSGGWDRGS
jgi:preprotein translocase subunit YajC